MIPGLNSEQQWRKWFRGFIGFLKSQIFVGEFFNLGRYQCPMEILEVEEVDKELPTKRSLTFTFNQMAAMASSVKDSAEKKGKKGGKDDAREVKETIMEEPSTKCLVFDHHPIFDICDISENVKDMKAANKFYVKVLQYIMNIIEFAVHDNNKANGIFIKYDKNVERLFEMMEELTKEFSVKTDFENTIRISKFGLTKMRECNCKSVDEFINYIYGEKRWLYDTFGTIKSDNEMIKALQFGIVEFDRTATRFLINQCILTPNISFDEIVRSMKDSKKQFEFLNMEAQGGFNYGSCNYRNGNNMSANGKRGSPGFVKRSPNTFNRPNSAGNNGKSWPFYVPVNERAAYTGIKCYKCGITGHKGSHHYNPAMGNPVGMGAGLTTVGFVSGNSRLPQGGNSGGGLGSKSQEGIRVIIIIGVSLVIEGMVMRQI